MRFVDEFRDADKAHALAARIAALCEPGRQYKLMEVCGGHTHTIYKHGLEDYLPESITLVHGPGCPVCVIPMGRVDDAIHLASQPDVIMTSFGDMMRVPGSNGAFFDANARGTNIKMVYSPLDSLKIAKANPDKRVVFMAIGVVDGDLERVERRVHEPHVGAAGVGLDQISLRPRHSHHVAECGEDDAGLLGQPHRVVDAAHRDDAHRASGPVDELDRFGQEMLDSVAVDGVSMAAAHLHEFEMVVSCELGDRFD